MIMLSSYVNTTLTQGMPRRKKQLVRPPDVPDGLSGDWKGAKLPTGRENDNWDDNNDDGQDYDHRGLPEIQKKPNFPHVEKYLLISGGSTHVPRRPYFIVCLCAMYCIKWKR